MRTDIARLIEHRISLSGQRWALRDTSSYQHRAYQGGPTRIQGLLAHARGCPIDQIDGLLDPSLRRHMPDPSVLRDMDLASSTLADAIVKDKPILIFGDYDVDGATSTAIMERFLRMTGATRYRTLVPNRETGYGFGEDSFQEAMLSTPSLILLLDCGTQNHETIQSARSRGIDVVVIDHHKPGATLPDATALVNPHRLDESPDGQHLRNLCTAGLAFMLAVATNRDLRRLGRYQAQNQPDIASLLDLAALGTVCDVMKLTGLNRSFVKIGINKLNLGANLGLKALSQVAGIRQDATPTALGFHLGPRINAGGRVGEARIGADLLASEDWEICQKKARQLNDLNQERQAIELQVKEEALAQVDPEASVIVVAGNGWHHGVIGIVAGRIKEIHKKPTIVIGIDDDGIGKGSGRSINGIDLGQAIMDLRDEGYLKAGGGHAMACGITIEPAQIASFRDALIHKIGAASTVAREANADLFDDAIFTTDITSEMIGEIEQIGPYGNGWPKPSFILGPAKITSIRALKGGHYAFNIEDGNGSIEGICWRADEKGFTKLLTSGGELLLSGSFEINTFRDRNSPRMVVDDLMIP